MIFTKFNPNNKGTLTAYDTVHPTMGIKTQDDADQYMAEFEKYMASKLEKSPPPLNLTPKDVCRYQIGFWANYFTDVYQRRVKQLFNAEAPSSASFDGGTEMSSEDMFELTQYIQSTI